MLFCPLIRQQSASSDSSLFFKKRTEHGDLILNVHCPDSRMHFNKGCHFKLTIKVLGKQLPTQELELVGFEDQPQPFYATSHVLAVVSGRKKYGAVLAML